MSTAWKSLINELDVERVLEQIETIARTGQSATGEITRLAFSPEDQAARKLLVKWMAQAGLEIRRDPVGNLIGTLVGSRPEAPVVACGSHIDSVINAGKYDGVLGTLAAVECARVIHKSHKLGSALEVICFVMEESSRFGSGYGFGSRAMTGSPIFPAQLKARDGAGISLSRAVAEMNSQETGSLSANLDEDALLAQASQEIQQARRDFSPNGAFLELHIEQGPVLEQAGKKIGIVTSVAAPIRFRMRFSGEQNHSGTTPMNQRHDALAAAAEAVLVVERICQESARQGIVGTVGAIQIHPGVMNVIPGRAEILVDIRSANLAARAQCVSAVQSEISAICLRRAIGLEVEKISADNPVDFSGRVIGAIEAACADLHIDAMQLASGAGHDAAFMAKVVESGMIFIPSLRGISHDPGEAIRPEDVKMGLQVLLAAILKLAD